MFGEGKEGKVAKIRTLQGGSGSPSFVDDLYQFANSGSAAHRWTAGGEGCPLGIQRCVGMIDSKGDGFVGIDLMAREMTVDPSIVGGDG